jgi:hypothetical protein
VIAASTEPPLGLQQPCGATAVVGVGDVEDDQTDLGIVELVVGDRLDAVV